MEFRDLKRQYSVLKNDINDALSSVAASGIFIGGDNVLQLERQLAEYVGVRHCITCANGTDALTIALKIWNVGPGDAVFVPDFTFFATAETVAAEGATPVFVDVDPITFNLSPQDLERKITSVLADGVLHPSVVIPVDLFGLPADFPAIKTIAQKYNLHILEDGAQGFGGSINGKMACSFGDIATTSFFPAKPLGCYGDGGAIFTDNDKWADIAASLKVHGRGAGKYDNVRIGMNSRLDAIQAAILLIKFRAFYGNELQAVNAAAVKYTELLQNVVITPFVPQSFNSSWAQYTIRLSDNSTRDRLQNKLKEKGIPSVVYYPTPMHLQTAFVDCPSFGSCPMTEMLCNTVLSLPIHPYITTEEILTVSSEIKHTL
ncbi:MAG: DegT/DnrJ/EryC1/StrS family aminotransferase [bacterium]|nr:DegT/DnrJ/EryC1/StrS family aminotransferase [Candidatus Minthenecus merdequi]